MLRFDTIARFFFWVHPISWMGIWVVTTVAILQNIYPKRTEVKDPPFVIFKETSVQRLDYGWPDRFSSHQLQIDTQLWPILVGRSRWHEFVELTLKDRDLSWRALGLNVAFWGSVVLFVGGLLQLVLRQRWRGIMIALLLITAVVATLCYSVANSVAVHMAFVKCRPATTV